MMKMRIGDVKRCLNSLKDGGDELQLLIWMRKVFLNEGMKSSDIRLLVHGDLFLICNDFNHCCQVMMNEWVVQAG